MARLLHGLIMATGLVASAAAQNETGGQGLHSLMVAAGKLYFGTAMETNNFNDTAYQAISSNRNEFGMFTPENSQKWEVTEPTQNKFSFTQADMVAMKVKSNGQMLRCHTLTWHSQLPGFGASLSSPIPIARTPTNPLYQLPPQPGPARPSPPPSPRTSRT